ncbi:MAG: hypothetical protein RL095_246 [Verrucomicrobiota bacterium]|jgi:hypothetical protein
MRREIQNEASIQRLLDLLNLIDCKASTAELKAKIAEGIEIRTVVEGATWDNRVDPRIARYVIDLKDALEEAFDLAGTAYKLAPSEVKVTLDKGSADTSFKVEEFLNKAVDTMGQDYTLLAILVNALLIIGGYSVVKIHARNKEAEEKASEERKLKAQLESEERKLQVQAESDERKFKLLAEVTHKALDMQRPLANLTRSMDENDTIYLPSNDTQLNRSVAMQAVKVRKAKTSASTYHSDGVYKILAMHINQNITIQKDEQPPVVARTAIKGNEREYIDKNFKLNKDNGREFELKLHVNVVRTPTAVKEIVITSCLNEPRKSSVSFAEAMGLTPRSSDEAQDDNDSQLTQPSLF